MSKCDYLEIEQVFKRHGRLTRPAIRVHGDKIFAADTAYEGLVSRRKPHCTAAREQQD